MLNCDTINCDHASGNEATQIVPCCLRHRLLDLFLLGLLARLDAKSFPARHGRKRRLRVAANRSRHVLKGVVERRRRAITAPARPAVLQYVVCTWISARVIKCDSACRDYLSVDFVKNFGLRLLHTTNHELGINNYIDNTTGRQARQMTGG